MEMIIPQDFVNTIFVIIVVMMGNHRMTVELGLGVGNVNHPITRVLSVTIYQSTRMAPADLRLSPEVHSKKIGGVIENTVISLIVRPGYATMTSICHTNSNLVCCKYSLYCCVCV
mgnify:CR=1 FL=1